MFTAMDTDNSGAITFDELKEGLRKYGSTLKDTEIRDLMDAVSQLSLEELITLLFTRAQTNMDIIPAHPRLGG